MRQIKFRVWDNVYQTFIDKTKYEIVFSSSNSSFGKMILRWNDYLPEEMFYPPNQVLNQFTGLLDKHGKEIYENDILKVKIGGDLQDNHWTVDSLEQLHIEFSRDDSYYRFTEVEIVGNIYENSELLNNK